MSDAPAILLLHADPLRLRRDAALLAAEGYAVHAGGTAEEGLRILGREPIRGVVADLHLPDVDGWRLCTLLRAPGGRHDDVPVLVTSDSISGPDATRLTAELGAHALLAAPYPKEALLAHVRAMLEGSLAQVVRRALVVGADSAAAGRLEAAFVARGYEVVLAAGLADARTRFGAAAPGIVVIDHRLPEGVATPFVAAIKTAGSATAVVVTRAERHGVLELLKNGADGFFVGPCDPVDVVTFCERARRQRALLRVQELLEARTKRLMESEGQLAAFFLAVPDIVLVHDRRGVILHGNAAAAKALDWELEQLVGRRVSEVIQGLEVEVIDGLVRSIPRHGVRRFETTYRTRRGDLLEVDVSASVTCFRDREAILLIARDVTESRRKDEERALLVAAVDQAAEMIVVSGPDGRMRYVNPAFERITGYTREEAVGAHINLLRAREEDDHTPWGEMWRVLDRGDSWRGRLRRRRRNGEVYTSEGTISPVRDDSGAIVHFVTVERDVTQEAELEHALRQAQKMEAVGTLAGGIAHDFNNLLTSILGYANLLVDSAAEGSEVKQMASVIENSAERASELTRQLLGFARRGKHRNVPVDLNDTIRDVVRLLDRTINKNIRIRQQLHEEPVITLGDPGQMEQALLNLALNARDAMKGGGELSFATQLFDMDAEYCRSHPGAAPGAYVVVTVTDTGCGIPRNLQQRIFEPFFTTKKPGHGTGMGLSMVYGIVKNHGGSIRVYSEEEHGTSFRVYLPVERQPRGAERDEPATETVRGTGRILVVDDEDAVRHTASNMLRRLGYDVVGASDGEEAVVYYRTFGQEVSLVLIDMVMPKMGGHDCFLALRDLDPEVKAVLSTGFGLNEAAQAILDEGVLGFVEKPYRISKLSQAVAAAIRGERYGAATAAAAAGFRR